MASLTILKVFGSILFFCVIGGIAMAQMEHHDSMGKVPTTPLAAPDRRVSLGLQPSVAESLKLTMREHLDALHAIVAALAHDDYEKAAAVAHEDLGFPKHHQAMQREAGATFPTKYHELATRARFWHFHSFPQGSSSFGKCGSQSRRRGASGLAEFTGKRVIGRRDNASVRCLPFR